MKINPVYEKEHRISTRSMKLAMAILIFNFIIAGVTLVEMNGVVDIARKTSSIDYASFLKIFKIVVFLQIALIIFVAPSFIAGTISEEKQRGTLEILLTTKMSAFTIVTGKFMNIFVSVMLMLSSQLPIVAILFLYGGLSAGDIMALVVNFIVLVVLVTSMGIFFSTVANRTSIATVLVYLSALALFAGTLVLYLFAESSFLTDENNIFGIWLIKFSKLLLLFNPIVSIDFLFSKIMGESSSDIIVSLFWYDNWFYISIILELLLSAVFILISAYKIRPHRKAWRKYGSNNI